MLKRAIALSSAVVAYSWVLPVAAQDAVAQFYRGKTVTIIIGSGAGGSIYDTYGRLLARYLGKHIPGEPSVVVSNMPGAGSENAAAYVARVAVKDGTYIAATNQNQPLDPILEAAPHLNYDPSRMNYLGSSSSDVSLCIVRHDAPAMTFGQMFKTPVVVGATAPAVPMAYLPIALNNVLGTKFKVVLGYPSAAGIMLAIQKGEVQGLCGVSWETLETQYSDLLEKGVIKIVVQMSDKGLQALNKIGVPLTDSYTHDEQGRDILDILYSQELFARPYFVAAEVPADRLRALRQAFIESWRDPDLLNEAAKINLSVQPMTGEEIEAILRKIYASPPALLQSVRNAMTQK